MKLDWLKKIRDQPVAIRKQWVSTKEPLALTRQCALAGINRTTVYAPRLAYTPDAQELKLLELIDTEYTRYPFYGSRKIKRYLNGLGRKINRKHVQRLMRLLGSRIQYQSTAPAAQGVSVSAQRREYHPPQSGLEYGHYVHTRGAWLCILGGRD